MQILEEQAMPYERIFTGLCVECALRHHDYQEMLPHGRSGDQFSEAPLPAAWIDGRRHRVVTPVGMERATCHECNREVPSIYLPIAE